jgi:transcriptional regulator with XRE-family HTH domain
VARYDLRYETRGGRCAWCWGVLGQTESHTVVRALAAPHLELRFHHRCWPAYKSLSGVAAGAVGLGGDWDPPRLERLRLHAGMDVEAFARHLGASADSYRNVMAGDASALGPGLLSRAKALAVQVRFEQDHVIDWTRGEAVFCLRMAQGWSLREMARQVGCSAQQLQVWQWRGVQARSVRTHGRLTALARQHGFDAGMVLAHRLWTREYFVRLVEENKDRLTYRSWSLASRGASRQAVLQWANGSRKITPESAWHLTQAALRLGLPLPPAGMVPLRKGAWSEERKPPSPEGEARRLEALREAKWTLESLGRLGTVPDRVLAREVGRSRGSVAIMRRALGIDAVDVRGWDGAVRPPPLAPDELQRRWDASRERARERQRLQRGEGDSPPP